MDEDTSPTGPFDTANYQTYEYHTRPPLTSTTLPNFNNFVVYSHPDEFRYDAFSDRWVPSAGGLSNPDKADGLWTYNQIGQGDYRKDNKTAIEEMGRVNQSGNKQGENCARSSRASPAVDTTSLNSVRPAQAATAQFYELENMKRELEEAKARIRKLEIEKRASMVSGPQSHGTKEEPASDGGFGFSFDDTTAKLQPDVMVGSIYATMTDPDTFVFRCTMPECAGKTFRRVHELRRHYNGAHATQSSVYWCNVSGCERSSATGGRPFSRRDKLSDHMRMRHSLPQQNASPRIGSEERNRIAGLEDVSANTQLDPKQGSWPKILEFGEDETGSSQDKRPKNPPSTILVTLRTGSESTTQIPGLPRTVRAKYLPHTASSEFERGQDQVVHTMASNSLPASGKNHSRSNEEPEFLHAASELPLSQVHGHFTGLEKAFIPHSGHNIDAYILPWATSVLDRYWRQVQRLLPPNWMWDVEYYNTRTEDGGNLGSWTCTPLEPDEPKNYPLTIANAPVVLPVEYQWPPMGGVTPPPDPRPSAPMDCCAEVPVEVVRDIFLTFEGSIGFYVLISGLLQIIVPDYFDTVWASSHLPHKYGGLKVCYIPQTMEATMLPGKTQTTNVKPSVSSPSSSMSSLFRSSRLSNTSLNATLQLNDFIEARPKSNHKKEKYSGRVGLKVSRDSEPFLLMSTHVITEAILAKSHREAIFGRSRDRFEKLDDDWNDHAEIWAGNEKIGTIDKTFDTKAEIYPNGFHHDVTIIKPTTPAAVKDIASPITGLGWLNRESWTSLRRQTATVKILGPTETHLSAKSLKCNHLSDILVVGEGIFLNHTAAGGGAKNLKDHDASTWKDLVSRALLYRVYPDFDPPNGYSGIALYTEGTREDGTEGPGIVGFQSFVQRSGHVQNFEMEGPALERRLQLGRVAFYGAFEVPTELKDYTIV